MGIDYKKIKFVKNVAYGDRTDFAYDQHTVGKKFNLWFSDSSKPNHDKFDIDDIVLLYQRLSGNNNSTLTHLVRILDKNIIKVKGGYELQVEVVGTASVLKSVTSVCDYMTFKRIGQSGKLVRLQESIKGHIKPRTVRKRLVEIFSELGKII